MHRQHRHNVRRAAGRAGTALASALTAALATLATLTAGAALAQSAPAAAPDWPKRPLRFVAGFPPGSSSDIVGRLIGQKLSERLGQPVVVEQKVGATGVLASDVVAKSPPDGLTLVMLSGAHPVSAVIMKALPFDPVADFSFVSTVTTYPLVLAVRADSPIRTLRELIDRAKAQPDRVTFSSLGPGSVHLLVGELLNIEAGVSMVGVPFKGGAPALIDVLGGRVDAMIETATFTQPQVGAGKLRALAVTSGRRDPLMPDVPAIAETVPGIDVSSWLGLATAPRTPRPIVDRLNREIRDIIVLPDVRQRLNELGGVPTASTPEEMRERIERDIARWQRVVRIKKIEQQ